MNQEELFATMAQTFAQMANPGGLGVSNLAVQRAMTVSTAATPFGCCNFFDVCGDGDLMSLHFNGQLPFLDWVGFDVSDECKLVSEYIDYVRPAQSEAADTPGYLGDPCADPYGVEYGTSKIETEDFGRIGRMGPTRDLMKPKKYCASDPIWRLDGTQITDEREWDLRFAVDQILTDVNNLVVVGSDAVAGQFDGLQQWVSTGYASAMQDSIVIDWNSNPMTGGAGITWNGAAVSATANLVDVLLATVRRIKQRISWSNRLKVQPMNVGDMIILMPYGMIPCLLDHFTCWSVCDGSQYNEVALQSLEARTFRTGLLGGSFGYGKIMLDGFEIPVLAYDWSLINAVDNFDFYVLTRAVGSVRLWQGQHISAMNAISQAPENGYFSLDGGRLLGRIDTENECRTLKAWMHPRLFCRAPWAQARFQNVVCDTPGGVISPDPSSGFHPLDGAFTAAECEEEEIQ